MMRAFRLFGAAVVLAAPALLLAATGPALAHERRIVSGKYQFVVGFLTEPAFQGQINGVDLRVSIPSDNDKPVEGLEKTLQATVTVGGGARSLSVQLEPRFRTPGAYNGHFMPTRAGTYLFQFTGTIEGTPINEGFESGPGRFNDVQPVQPLQFPDSQPDFAGLSREVGVARDEAAAARAMAMAGLAVGVVGLIAGVAGLAAARARRPRDAGSQAPARVRQ